jgi:hypothetical protein
MEFLSLFPIASIICGIVTYCIGHGNREIPQHRAGAVRYTLADKELDVFEGVEFERHERFQFFGELFVSVFKSIVNGTTKYIEVIVKTIGQTLFLQKLPIPFNQIQVWRITRQKDQLDVQ